VLSCGEFMADWPGCTVLTICTGIPPEGTPSSSYDQSCGFPDPEHGIIVRKDEERRALGLLRARSICADLLDNQYRDTPLFPDRLAVDHIIDALLRVRPRRVLTPLGLVHPDHRGVAWACREAMFGWAGRDIEWWIYEDLPSRVHDPVAAAAAIDQMRLSLGYRTGEKVGDGDRLRLVPRGTDHLAEKLIALGEYGSQSWAWRMAEVSCPERLWEVTR